MSDMIQWESFIFCLDVKSIWDHGFVFLRAAKSAQCLQGPGKPSVCFFYLISSKVLVIG